MNEYPTDVPGYELVTRTAIVRLGSGGPYIHTNGTHASLGVVSIAVDSDYYLVVTTDFDSSRELILSAQGDVDLQLAKKGVFCGASGGSTTTKFGLWSSKDLPFSSNGTKYAGEILPPQSSVFNPAVDNLWLTWHSLRTLDP